MKYKTSLLAFSLLLLGFSNIYANTLMVYVKDVAPAPASANLSLKITVVSDGASISKTWAANTLSSSSSYLGELQNYTMRNRIVVSFEGMIPGKGRKTCSLNLRQTFGKSGKSPITHVLMLGIQSQLFPTESHQGMCANFRQNVVAQFEN